MSHLRRWEATSAAAVWTQAIIDAVQFSVTTTASTVASCNFHAQHLGQLAERGVSLHGLAGLSFAVLARQLLNALQAGPLGSRLLGQERVAVLLACGVRGLDGFPTNVVPIEDDPVLLVVLTEELIQRRLARRCLGVSINHAQLSHTSGQVAITSQEFVGHPDVQRCVQIETKGAHESKGRLIALFHVGVD